MNRRLTRLVINFDQDLTKCLALTSERERRIQKIEDEDEDEKKADPLRFVLSRTRMRTRTPIAQLTREAKEYHQSKIQNRKSKIR